MLCVLCDVEVSATSRLLVQRSPNECGVSEYDRGTSARGSLAHKRLSSHEKKKLLMIVVYLGNGGREQRNAVMFHIMSHY